MKSFAVRCISAISIFLVSVSGYKILAIFPTMALSHYNTGNTLMKGLADAGHNITVVSTFPEQRPLKNYRSIAIENSTDLLVDLMPNWLDTLKVGFLKTFINTLEYGQVISNRTLMQPALQSLLNDPTEQFDVIVIDGHRADALFGLGIRFNAPVIALSAAGASKWTTDLVGTPSSLSYVPKIILPFSTRMSFVERICNTLVDVLEGIVLHIYLYNQCDGYERAFPGKTKPGLRSVRKNISLVLVNSHFTVGFPRPYVPNMIEIGGIHIDRNAANILPVDIRNFVESASEHGFIYFSMGSIIKSDQLPISIRDGILKAFSKLKQKILWKWEDPNLPGKPENVLIRKWFPQNDLLKHPNIRLFITHGGINSCTEAVYHGIPIIGIPMFGDQQSNVANAVEGGYGLLLSYTNLTETSISWTLNEILESNKYSEKAKHLSARYRDQPMTPLQTGVFWVEYVARHKGAPHMHSAGQDLSWIAHRNIDVYAFLVLIAYTWYYITKILMQSIIRKLFKKNPSLSDPKKSE